MEIATVPLLKELESTALVRFQDCDPFGHLNNARYIDYFMNARQDQLARDYGFDIFGVARQTNEGWVVSKTQIAYLAPARMTETVRIRTRLIHISDSTLVVEGLMLDQDATQLKSVAWIEFTFVSLSSGRRVQHSPDFMQKFGAVVVEGVYDSQGFHARVEALRGEYRRNVPMQTRAAVMNVTA